MGGSYAQGCEDKTLPQENKTIELPHRLYFARKYSGWGQGGIAFISVEKEKDQEEWTEFIENRLLKLQAFQDAGAEDLFIMKENYGIIKNIYFPRSIAC